MKMRKGKASHAAAEPYQNHDEITGLQKLKADQELWYKIHILLYDLCNISTDRASESRTLETTDELYISAPYFTRSEAALIKSTLVQPPVLNVIPEFEFEGDKEIFKGPEDRPKIESSSSSQQAPISHEPEATLLTIKEAIKSRLENFFEKRRASGDARPCGPHDMGPIYLAVFGIAKEELKDEKFLSRLRRAGLPKLENEVGGVGEKGGSKVKGGGKKGARKG